MSQDASKQAVAKAAAAHLRSRLDSDSIVGVGTGSTANYFIDELAGFKGAFDGAVASSEATAQRLRGHGIPVYDLNSVGSLEFYVDGADEVNGQLELIKGGGGALTREKIVAAVARTFICIVDESKQVDLLGDFPLPVEVIPMARSHVGREIGLPGGFRDRQWQHHPGYSQSGPGPAPGKGTGPQSDCRHGHQRPVRAPAGGPAAGGYR